MKKILVSLALIVSISISNAQEISSLQWIKQIEVHSTQIGTAIALIPTTSGGYYTTGAFRGNTSQLPFVPGEALFSEGMEDIIIISADQSNTINWTKRIGGTLNDRGNSITRDASGNIIITGYFEGTVDFNPSTGVANLTSNGGKDIFICKLNSGGAFLWAKSLGGNGDDQGNYISKDNLGNLYITGVFKDTVDFDPGAGNFEKVSQGEDDVFILKLDNLGNFRWAKSFGGTNNDFSNYLLINSNSEIYTVGNFRDSIDMDPNIGVVNFSSSGNTDIFISKLDTAGNFIWAQSYGGVGDDNCSSIAKDSQGNIYATGGFSNTVNFNPVSGPSNLSSSGGKDIFVLKISPTGNYMWAKKMGGAQDDFGTSIEVDPIGHPLIYGYFQGTSDFNPAAAVNNIVAVGNKDIFFCKLTYLGNFKWVKQIGGLEEDLPTEMKIYSNRVYSTGRFKGMSDFNPVANLESYMIAGDTAQFLSCIDTAGAPFYGPIQSGNTSGSPTTYSSGLDTQGSYATITTDSMSNVFCVAQFTGVIDTDPGPGVNTLISYENVYSAYCCKFDQAGNFIWANQLRSRFTVTIVGITTDRLGNVYITGNYSGLLDCEPGPGTYYLTDLDSSSSNNAFIIKYDNNGNLIWAKKIEGTVLQGTAVGSAIKTDESNNLYVSGLFTETIDFDPGIGIINMTSLLGSSDIFVLMLDSIGNFVWAKQIGGVGGDLLLGMELDNNANIFGIGMFYAESDFDPGPGVFNLPCIGNSDMFLFKLDSEGNFIAAKSIGNAGEYTKGLGLDINNSGDVLITGYARGVIDLDPGPGILNYGTNNENLLFISKFDSLLNLTWTKVICQIGYGDAYPNNLACDEEGGIYISGNFSFTVDFNPDAAVFNLTHTSGPGIFDGFLLKLDNNGNFVWVSKFGGISTQCYHATATRNKDIYVDAVLRCSTFVESGTGNYTINAKGRADYAIAKYRSCFNTSATLSVQTCNSYFFNGSQINNSGVYYDTIANTAGCDSIITLNLTIIPNYYYTESYGLCNGQTFNWHGQIIISTGIYYDTLQTMAGCDSIFTLIVDTSYYLAETMNICSGSIFNWHGSSLSATGIYYDSLLTVTGCDSIFTLNLSVNPSFQLLEIYSLCTNQSIFWHGQWINTIGTFYDNLQGANGCDSTFTLIVNNPSSLIENANICPGQQYLWRGNYYSSSGLYSDSLLSVNGCDSIFQLNLTVSSIDNSVTVLSPLITANLSSGVLYQWLNCNNMFLPIIGENQQSFIATVNGDYAVEITQGVCKDTSSCINITIVGLESTPNSEFVIYPTPVSDELSIVAKGIENENCFELLNSIGELISKGSFKGKTIINMSNLANGVYLIRIYGLSITANRRVIKN